MFFRGRQEQGAVSVFLIMIFAFVFAFVAVCIDFSRMIALQAQSEELAHAAVRSVLSSYDQELMSHYGLFAQGETDGNYIMSKVLEQSMETSVHKDGFNLLGAKLDSSELEMSRPLGTYAVFDQQIQEQMKYKAPVNLGLDFVSKLKPMSGVMKEASNAVDVLGKLQKLYDKREKLIDQVYELQKVAVDKMKLVVPTIQSGSSNSNGSASIGGAISNLQDSASQYGDFVDKVREDSGHTYDEQIHTAEISNFRNGTAGAFNRTEEANQKNETAHMKLTNEPMSLIEQAVEINEQMKRVIKESESRQEGAAYDKVNNGATGNQELTDIDGSEAIKKIRQRTESLIREESFFTTLSNNLDQQITSYRNVTSSIGNLMGLENSVLSASAQEGIYSQVVASAGQNTQRYVSQFQAVLANEDQEVQKQRASQADIDDKKSKADGKLSEAKGLISKLSGLKDEYQQLQKDYDELNGYYEDNLKLNKEQSASSGEPEQTSDDVYDSGTSSMKGMDSLFGSFSDFLSKAADNAFQTEYAADYFKAFEVTQLKKLATSGTAGLSAGNFAPDQQEMEYILYGFHNPGGNMAAAFGEIFAVRLAIRTMEGLIKNAGEVHPLLILVTAVLYGLEHAVKDLIDLTEKGYTDLSYFLQVHVTYRDYLRMFMLVHGASNNRLSRMTALIRYNTGIDPDERDTYVSGKVTTGIKLLFVPGVAKAINATFSREGVVEGGTYFAEKLANDSY